MSDKHSHQETAVEQMRRVRDQLNREIEATSGKALLDQISGHRYSSAFLQRLASKAKGKTAESGTASGSR